MMHDRLTDDHSTAPGDQMMDSEIDFLTATDLPDREARLVEEKE